MLDAAGVLCTLSTAVPKLGPSEIQTGAFSGFHVFSTQIGLISL